MSATRPPSSRGRGRGRLRDYHSQSPAARSDEERSSSPRTTEKSSNQDDGTPITERRERRERKTRRPDVQVYVPRGRRLQGQQNHVAPGTNRISSGDTRTPKTESSRNIDSQKAIESGEIDNAYSDKQKFMDAIEPADTLDTARNIVTDVSNSSKADNDDIKKEKSYHVDKQSCHSLTDDTPSVVHDNLADITINYHNSVLSANISPEQETGSTANTNKIGIDLIEGEQTELELQRSTNNDYERCKKKMKISENPFNSNTSHEVTASFTNLSDDAKISQRAESQADLENPAVMAETDASCSEKVCSDTEHIGNVSNGSAQEMLCNSDKTDIESQNRKECLHSESSEELKQSIQTSHVISTETNNQDNSYVSTDVLGTGDLTGVEGFNKEQVSEKQNNKSILRSQATEESNMNSCEHTDIVSENGKSFVTTGSETDRHLTIECCEDEKIIDHEFINESKWNKSNSVGTNETARTQHTFDDSEMHSSTVLNKSDAGPNNDSLISDDETSKMESGKNSASENPNCDSEENNLTDFNAMETENDKLCKDDVEILGTDSEMEGLIQEKGGICQSSDETVIIKDDELPRLTNCDTMEDLRCHQVLEENLGPEVCADKSLLESSLTDQSEERNPSTSDQPKNRNLSQSDQSKERNLSTSDQSKERDLLTGEQSEEKIDSAGDQSDEDSWDRMFDDNGDCLDPTAMEELTKTVGKVKIQKSKKINYLNYQPKDKSADLDYTSLGHIIEIYDFPAEFVTRDLIMAFQSFMSRGFDLKWVDDTHALGIFSSAIAAQDALSMIHPLLKVCPLSQASAQSKSKARKCTEFLQPYKPRPETSAVAARRLVAGALGLQSKVPKEKRDKERQQLKEAKAKQRQDRQKREDIWEGKLGRCAMDEES